MRNPVSRRRSIAPAACAGLIMATSAALMLCVRDAKAGPCTAQIAQLEHQIGGTAASPDSTANASQSVAAQLHHQPTPGAVQSAEHVANADADAALERARQADAAGNADACDEALRDAKRRYGID